MQIFVFGQFGNFDPSGAGALFLLLHAGLEAFRIHAVPDLFGHDFGQVDGEAEGIVELKGYIAGEGGAGLQFGGFFFK